MQKILLFIDKVSTFVGRAFSWFIVGLTLFISWEVFSRYALDTPHAWAFDAMIMMYGTLFMMAGAYTLSQNGHVRGDVIYGFFSPRAQAAVDLTLYIVFFIPAVIALVWAGYTLIALIVAPTLLLMPWGHLTNGHLGLMMLSLIVVGIMMGFPTAFTLMGMGVFFAWLAYRSVNPALANRQVLDLFVQRTYGVMSNDVLIAIPLFLFMGYLVERAQLIDKLFRSLHLALARVPGALAVATIVTCAIFATATGIVGAVVTLMGLLAFPAMLKAGYNIKVSAGGPNSGGCLV